VAIVARQAEEYLEQRRAKRIRDANDVRPAIPPPGGPASGLLSDSSPPPSLPSGASSE